MAGRSVDSTTSKATPVGLFDQVSYGWVLQSVFDHAPVGIALSSPGSLMILEANPKLKADLRRPSIDSWTELFHPEDAATVLPVLMSPATTGPQTFNCRMIRGDGTILWVHLEHRADHHPHADSSIGVEFVQPLHHRNVAAAILAGDQPEGMQRVHALLQDLVQVKHLLRSPPSTPSR